MIEVRLADSPQPELVERLLRSLPTWFGIESSIVEYVEASRRLPTLVALTDDVPVGVLLYEQHFATCVEIHLMAVSADWHRRGAGRALVDELCRIARIDGVSLIEVKTLGASHPDPGYAKTRLFYEACGFLAVEELPDYWPGNPCLIMVKPP